VTTAGTFTAGRIVANTTNQTTAFDLDQNRYTELEYAINLTVNAINDAYCFRVTNAGSALDSYAVVPELSLAFDPSLDTIILNNGLDISLIPGTTTRVVASTTVTDFNGVGDLSSATTTFYTTAAGAACTQNSNSCYIASGADCQFVNCGSTSCSLLCSANFAFHATPTDSDGSQEWFAFVEVSDVGGSVDFGTSPGRELLTLRALTLTDSINYGILNVNENTGSFNPSVNLFNIGNEAIDVEVSGTDMTDGGSSVIPAAQQRYSTTTFTYASCTTCQTLTNIGDNLEIDLPRPTSSTPLLSDQIYWGIAVPFGIAPNPHSGLNTFMAIPD
jgi:hypothetical protein